MAKIRQSNLDSSIITGLTELNKAVADTDYTIIYDTSAGTLKKVLRSNIKLNTPTFTSVSPTSVNTGDGTGNATLVITGTGFVSGTTANLKTTGGTTVNFDSVTIDSTTQLTCVIAISSLSNANEPYDIVITNPDGTTTSEDQVNINAQPVYVTASGSLGSFEMDTSQSVSVNATDPESAGNVTFELQSGSLPPGLSLTNTAAEGGTGIISGTISSVASETTFNFVLRAIDTASNTTSRAFSITVTVPPIQTFTSSGTFSVPSGITTVDVLIVGGGGSGGSGAASHTAGGGGGAGGLIYFPCYPVTPGGTITLTVGCGGPTNTAFHDAGTVGQDSVFGAPGDPGFSPTSSVLTAKGGGAGSSYSNPGTTGGSGGGGGTNNTGGGTATQPTQPGNSGAYGFGNNGGTGQPYNNFGEPNGGGGGGAGGAGANATSGTGGVGKAYTIADGTTPVYYAGGGGGGSGGSQVGGQGGGGTGGQYPREAGCAGQANKGGGGGGAAVGGPVSPEQADGGAGGKGIIIVSTS